jgi:predicted Zn-dependent peptidase
MHQKKKLSSGAVLLLLPVAGIKTTTVMALFGAGSREEKKENQGVAHFLEHMLFKGTSKRPTYKEVSEELDKIGGICNAFTSKEYSGYYAKTACLHFDLALDWLSDIIGDSFLAAEEIEKEKGVIVEELNLGEDTPTQNIHDVFEALIFNGGSLAKEIIGTKETIRKMNRQKLFSFREKNYQAKNCVICVAGKIPAGVVSKVDQAFSFLKKKKSIIRPLEKEDQKEPRLIIKNKKTDQAHLVVGFRTSGLKTKERYALCLAETVLGEGMSSRLFEEVREKRGLAYYIGAASENYTDAGYIGAMAGVENKKLEEALRVILAEFKKLKETLIPNEELKKAKECTKGHSLISLESSNSRAFYFGISQILLGKVETLEERFRLYNKVTPQEIKAAARKFFTPNRLNFALISPMASRSRLEKIIKEFN